MLMFSIKVEGIERIDESIDCWKIGDFSENRGKGIFLANMRE